MCKENKKSVSIYMLICPVTAKVRYIGQTKQKLSRRLASHLQPYKTGEHKNGRQIWIENLNSEGLKPIIREITKVKSKAANREEYRQIVIFKRKYKDLLNIVNPRHPIKVEQQLREGKRKYVKTEKWYNEIEKRKKTYSEG